MFLGINWNSNELFGCGGLDIFLWFWEIFVWRNIEEDLFIILVLGC